MPMRLLRGLGLVCGLVLLLAGLVGCDLLQGVQDTGTGTPAVISTPVATVPAGELGSTYAYISGNQLWVALRGGRPRQMTSFADSSTPDVYWHIPAWSAGDRYLAVIVDAEATGEGGGGCPGPQFGANGALYVLDTTSMRLNKLTVPADPLAGKPQNGYWQSVFWQDATHLLAWYNGAPTANNAAAGLYRYDVQTHSLARLLTSANLGVTTLFSQQVTSGEPILLGLRYSQGYLYYQEVQHPFSAQSELLIGRISLTHGGTGQTVFVQGNVAWCTSAPSPYIEPGWDIAPDGQRVVAQVVNPGKSGVEMFSFSSGQSARIFADLPVAAFGHDLTLAWSPNAQAIAAAESHAFSQDGPFCVLLARPGGTQSYTPAYAGQIAWRPDSQAFTLQNPDLVAAPATNTPVDSLEYIAGQNGQKAPGIVLLMGARDFAWG